MKSIELIIKLSKNPAYVLSEDETFRLREHLEGKTQNVKADTSVVKNYREVQKHNTEVKEEKDV